LAIAAEVEALGVGHRGASIEVDAEDVESRAGERPRGGRAEAGRCAEDERPPVQAHRNGGVGHASLRILA